MIFFTEQSGVHFEEEEESEGGIDDALLGELDDETIDDELLAEEIDPLIKSPLDVLAVEEGAELDDKEEGVKFVEDDEEEDVDDYDSFDDEDEM